MEQEEVAGRGISAGQTPKPERAWSAWESRNISLQFSVRRGEMGEGRTKKGVMREDRRDRLESGPAGLGMQ